MTAPSLPAKPPSARDWCKLSTRLSDNTGLALTTYHYYTPSGRLIQRNYKGVSLYDYYYNHDQPQDWQIARSSLPIPDARSMAAAASLPTIKIDSAKVQRLPGFAARALCLLRLCQALLANRTVGQDFQVDDSVMQAFKQFLTSQQISYTDQDFNQVMDWVKANIKAEIFTTQFGEAEGLKVRANRDPMVAKAIDYLPQAEALENAAKHADSQRASVLRQHS